MKQQIKLGVVCLTRNTFDFQAAEKLYANILSELVKKEKTEVFAVEKAIMDEEESVEAGRYLASANVDAVAIISGTFHLGHLALNIKKICDKPLLLWGLPELPYNGGKIRLNSVCGVNLNASNLVKSGIKDFTYHVGSEIDENWLDAVRMMVALRESRIGIVGYRADGFFNVGVDELSTYGKFGVLINHYELSELWDEEAKSSEENRFLAIIEKNFCLDGIDKGKIKGVAVLAAKLQAFMEKKKLTALAIRCWPEFAAGFGIAPCASMSLLQSQGSILACEGDIDCALTMICHKAVGAETPFMADLSQVDISENHALLWHCGVAPCNLSDGVCCATLDSYHAGGKGMTAGFVLKEGTLNAARLDSVGGKYRLFNEKGTALPMEKLLTGTYAKVRFEKNMKEVLDKVVYSGIAHHVSVVYGDFSDAFKIFARLKDIEVL